MMLARNAVRGFAAFCVGALVLVCCQLLQSKNAAASEKAALWAALKSGKAFAIMRHELAPGTGDPANFDVNDCATQRNLSDVGRAQSVQTGKRFKANGIGMASMYSSAWCRCKETAALMDIGSVQILEPLNSFYEQPQHKERRMTALRAWLKDYSGQKPLVLVTHQVTISALTGMYASSGEVAVVERAPDGTFRVLGSL